ncbi:membrane protein [Mycobacterium tuberculosis]|nr:membrane protein [Mycobacterium tuberculosis]
MLLGILTLLLSACQTASASGYNEPRGYDRATLKLVFSMDLGMCLNRFTYDSKLAPSRPQVVACDSREARIRNDGFHANAPSCMRIDYELITQNHRAYYCLKYLVRVGYCYPAVTPPASRHPCCCTRRRRATNRCLHRG